jgi:hypothetical protein
MNPDSVSVNLDNIPEDVTVKLHDETLNKARDEVYAKKSDDKLETIAKLSGKQKAGTKSAEAGDKEHANSNNVKQPSGKKQSSGKGKNSSSSKGKSKADDHDHKNKKGSKKK